MLIILFGTSCDTLSFHTSFIDSDSSTKLTHLLNPEIDIIPLKIQQRRVIGTMRQVIGSITFTTILQFQPLDDFRIILPGLPLDQVIRYHGRDRRNGLLNLDTRIMGQRRLLSITE